MKLINYIPLNDILDAFGLVDKYQSSSISKGVIEILPSVVNGIGSDVLLFQYNPEKLEFSGKVNYATHAGKGTKPILEYINTELEKIPLSFVLVDDINSQEDEDRDLPSQDSDLLTTMRIFQDLSKPTLSTNRPPKITISWGSILVTGYVIDYNIKILKTNPDLSPKIVEINLSIEGEVE